MPKAKMTRIIDGRKYSRTGTIYTNKKVAQTVAKENREKYGHPTRVLLSHGRTDVPKSVRQYQLWVAL